MHLDDFADEVIALLELQPTPPEICVSQVSFFRGAATEGRFDQALAMLSGQK